MGLLTAKEIEAIGNSMNGSFLIAGKGNPVMLGCGMAPKIMVA
jgi:hypothetical protein